MSEGTAFFFLILLFIGLAIPVGFTVWGIYMVVSYDSRAAAREERIARMRERRNLPPPPPDAWEKAHLGDEPLDD